MTAVADMPGQKRPRRGRRLMLVTFIALVAVSAAIVPARALYRESQRQIAMDRMRDTLAAFQYAAFERGGALPPVIGWETDLGYMQRSMSPRMLDSGRVEGPTPDWVYAPPIPAPGQTHATLSEIEQPSMYVLLYEDTSRLPAQHTSVIVGMADGSVQMMDREELTSQLAEQTAKQEEAEAGDSGAGPE